MYTINRPSKIKSITSLVQVSTAVGGGSLIIGTSGVYNCRLSVETGPVYLTVLTTSPTVSNTIKISSSGVFEFISQESYISLLSTSVNPTYELILYKD